MSAKPTTEDMRLAFSVHYVEDGDVVRLVELFDEWLAGVEREAAAEALEQAADADEKQAGYLLGVMPDVFSGLARERSQKRDQAHELQRSATRLRARAAAYRRNEGGAS